MTWPVAARLGTHIPGSEGDAWEHLWTFRWVRDSLLAGHSPFFTDRIFFPHGVSLTTHNIAWVNIAAWLPLQYLIGETAAYSIVFLAVFVFNGFAVYLLVRELTDSLDAAWIGGLIGAFWPYILSHFNSPNLILIGWIPLAIIYVKRTLENQNVRNALIAGILIALIGISRWQVLVMGGILIALFIGYSLLVMPGSRNTRALGYLLLTGFVALLIMLPLLYPLLVDQLNRQNPNEIFTGVSNQTDLLAYIIPSSQNALWGPPAGDLFYRNIGNNFFLPASIGYITLALAMFGTIKSWQNSRFWILAASFLILIALGPELLIDGRIIAPLPYRWVEDLFVFKILRHPDRFNIVLVIPVAVLAGLGIANLLEGINSRTRLKFVVVVALASLILSEYIVRFPILSTEVPEWYYELAQKDGDFGILDLPMGTRTYDEYYMRNQFIHGKALVGGKVSRPPQDAYTFIESFPFLQHVQKNILPPSALTRFSHQFQLLNQANVRYLIIHKNLFARDHWQAWKQWLDMKPDYEDDQLIVYRTDWDLEEEFILHQTGIDGLMWISSSLLPDSTAQDGWITAWIRWGVQNHLDNDFEICFHFRSGQIDDESSSCQKLSTEYPSYLWQSGEVIDVAYPIHFDPYLSGGVYEVVASVQPIRNDEKPTTTMSLGEVNFRALPRTIVYEADPCADRCIVKWSDNLALTDLEVTATDNQVEVAVNWIALSRLERSYKEFLHLTRKGNGSIIRQYDTAPLNWKYPTTWWEKNEAIEDRIQLDINDLEPGIYELWFGLYDEATGERLEIVEVSDRFPAVDDNRLLLDIIKR